jgi:AmiR/NasT family two-component response regulator
MNHTHLAVSVKVLCAAPRLGHIQRLLQEAGCRLRMANVPELTSLSMNEGDIDICLLDLDDMDDTGIGSHVHQLKSMASNVPIVLITKEVNPQRQQLCQRIGGMALLSHNVDVQALTTSLMLWVERDREMKALRSSELRLQEALAKARCVSHAVGVLAERHGISVNDAFQLLRTQARGARRRIEDVAQEVMPHKALSCE